MFDYRLMSSDKCMLMAWLWEIYLNMFNYTLGSAAQVAWPTFSHVICSKYVLWLSIVPAVYINECMYSINSLMYALGVEWCPYYLSTALQTVRKSSQWLLLDVKCASHHSGLVLMNCSKCSKIAMNTKNKINNAVCCSVFVHFACVYTYVFTNTWLSLYLTNYFCFQANNINNNNMYVGR